MSDGSDTDCTNKSGSDKMSRIKSPEQEADPQAMRGGGGKEINNVESSDLNEVNAGIKVKGNPLMTNLSQNKDDLNETENERNKEGRPNLTSYNSTNASTMDSLAHKVQFV